MNQQIIAAALWNFIVSGLLIYLLACMLIFSQTKQKAFLYYGCYNFFLCLYLLRLSPYISEVFSNDVKYQWFGSVFWLVQIVYNSFMFFFYLEFLNYKDYFPKSYRVIVSYLRGLLLVSLVLSVVSMAIGDVVWFNRFFNFVFIPTVTFFVFYGMYYTFKIPNRIKYFIVSGVLIYQVLAYVALFKSMNNTPGSGDYPVIYFYVGIVIESCIFMLGLGYKIRELHLEKINNQRKLNIEQAEKHQLKERYQEQMEHDLKMKVAELKSELQKNEEQRIRNLSIVFESEIAQLKLGALRQQMNPHFIFNAINSIKAFLIENEKENAIFYLSKFALLIRKILETSRTNSIPLGEELEIIKIYIGIEEIRYRHQIQIVMPEPDIISARIQLPGLILQPFIENALWHGLMLKEGQKSVIVAIFEEEGVYKLSITDNGIGRLRASAMHDQKTYEGESLGVKLSSERLNYFNTKHQTAYKFEYEDLYNEAGDALGTRVVFIFNGFEA